MKSQLSNTGHLIKEAMKRKGVTRKELSERTGLSEAQISMAFRKDIKLSTFDKIVSELDYSVEIHPSDGTGFLKITDDARFSGTCGSCHHKLFSITVRDALEKLAASVDEAGMEFDFYTDDDDAEIVDFGD